MPQHSTPSAETGQFQRRQPIQIAQAEPEGAPSHEGTHAETSAEHHGPKLGEVPAPGLLFWNSLLIAVGMIAFAMIARNKLARIPKGIGNFAEWVVESLNGFTTSIIGPHGEKYTPFIGTIFLFVYLCNIFGFVPILHSPTANMSITLALGIIVFVYVQIEGIKNNGLGGHIKHYMGPMPAISPLLFVVEIISDLIRPLTLAVRLFGNIFGDDVVRLVLAGLLTSLGLSNLGWVPMQFPVLILALLVTLVQAMVFSMLACVYLALVAPHDHHGDEPGGDHAHAHH